MAISSQRGTLLADGYSVAVGFIPLTQGKFAIVDLPMFFELGKHKWQAVKKGKSLINWYACRTSTKSEGGPEKKIYLHREVARLSGLPVVRCYDHRNHNTLDNTVENLRPCSQSQNCANKRKSATGKTSKFKGVSWNSRERKWVAVVRQHKKYLFLGKYDSETEAAKAYQENALKHFGEFACSVHC